MIKIRGKEIKAELANNILKQVKGLMFSSKKNLLFKMAWEDYHPFWMLFVKFPIKMVFINSDLEVVDIQHAEPMTLNPKSWKVYRSKQKCKYILELTEDVKIEVGDKVNI